ncbi:MAG TPA: diaminobutyrate acetyltransferase [Deltaproteobacteria bacterium]|nr:diaminobutyrate acetyltransferase [Deltaproteobacteria bacterium]
MTGEQTETETCFKEITYRKPLITDGRSIYNLVKKSPPLDLNSLYHYLIFCHYYNETSIVAEKDDSITGFISGFLKPGDGKTLFVWQVVVDESCRGKGTAKKMLDEIIARPCCAQVAYLETTVTPSNSASRSFFSSFARDYAAFLRESVLFPSSLFGKKSHEDEVLFTIGPLKRK